MRLIRLHIPGQARSLAFAAAIVALNLAVVGCAPGQNTAGTPTTAAEQVAAGTYGAYLTADGAWLAYLKTINHAMTSADRLKLKDLIAKVEPKRLAARKAADDFANAAAEGTNADAARVAFNLALAAFNTELTAGGVPLSTGATP